MPHAVSITDGTTTTSLSTTAVQLNKYTPQAATWDDSSLSYKPVTETIDILIYESTGTAAQTKIAAIERNLLAVQQRAMSGTGPKAYLQLRMTSDAQTWRSEILALSWVTGDDLFQSLPQGFAGFRLNVTRAPYWEGSLTVIPLTNGSGTNVTTGLSIANANGYVEIAAANVGGTLPTPLELFITNTTGAGRTYRNFYIGLNTMNTSLAQTIQGETCLSGYGTSTASANASGGLVGRITTVGATSAPMRWTIPAAATSIFRGRYANIIARLAQAPSGIRVRARVLDRLGFNVIHESPTVAIDAIAASGGQLNCGAFPLPGVNYDTTWGDVTFELTFYTTGTSTIDVDYLTLMPSDAGNFRHFYQMGYTIPNNGVIVDSGVTGNIYYNSAERDHIWRPYTEPIMLKPNTTQRLYMLIDGESNNVGWTHSLIAWYRPRRLTVGS